MDLERPPKIYIDYTALALRTGTVIAGHPFEYAKILIQMGYEPYPPTQGTFFGKPSLRLPNILQYLKYIKSVDGFFGCYRGLLPRLSQHVVSTVVYNSVAVNNPFLETDDYQEVDNKSKDKLINTSASASNVRSSSWISCPKWISSDVKAFLKRTGWDVVCVTAATTASYPLHVVTIRTMAQFVGREIEYSSIWKALVEIYNNDGILGFFKGLFPRLIGDVIYVVISATVIFAFTTQFGDIQGMDRVSTLTGGMVANSFAYQYQVVATNMAVNNSGLALGSRPYAKKSYESWYDCWKTLGQDKQLSRGNSMFGRYYLGPVVYANGVLRPVGFHFGPLYSAGFGFQEQSVTGSTTYPKKIIH